MQIATGFDCQPLPDGNVLIEFFEDDGETCNRQVVTPDVVRSMPLVATLTEVAISKGLEVAQKIMKLLSGPKVRKRRNNYRPGRSGL